MTDDTRSGLLSWSASIARDVLTMLAVMSAAASVIIALTRPYWKPFAELPENVLELQAQVADLVASPPRLLDFAGRPVVIDASDAKPGGYIVLGFVLRRNASCDTDVRPFFVNVETGVTVVGNVFPAVKAPVTADYIWFSLSVSLPDHIRPGRYVYFPEIVPKECGVYRPIRPPQSDIFEVIE